MPKKVSRINAIMCASNSIPSFGAVYFRVGELPLSKKGLPIEEMAPVETIKFAKYAWGTGAHVDQPSYGVSFKNSQEMLIIPASLITQVISITEDEVTPVTIPNMPE